ncbi:SgcJ/EcaC family oxidoreductase [Streptomyces sp. V4-01]|uniref:SgcJ/EcaC family oxidoreductase n=1 Tax=Actinacidiphila polyblastidii TaxID=3110430 RepID=A0ABU7PC48_9ACTN|nr:SgcJ/EcaC family oxidoreductase [Streptomyces sp. V4-01]
MSEKASTLVTQAKQWATQYGDFANGPEGAALTVPLRARAAWEANDARTYAGLFVENGSELIGDTQLKGSQEVLEYLTEAFEGPYRGSRLVEEPEDIRLISDDVAVVVTQGGVVRSGETAALPENRYRAMWMIVKRDGDWRLFTHQTSPLGG